jgi:hypothetical protein
VTLPFLGKVPWRLIGYGLAAVAIALLVWRIAAWREGYHKLDAAEAALEAERADFAGKVAKYLEDQKSAEIARQKLATDLAAITLKYEALKGRPPETLVRRITVPVEVQGVQVNCPAVRVSGEFVRVWNESASP